MYKDYNMIHLTLPMVISVLIPIHDISRHVNDIVETNTKTEFICPNNKRLVFKKYTYHHDKYGFKRDFKLYECDDDSECPLKHPCMNFNSKTKTIYSQRKIDVASVFRFIKAILSSTRMSVRGINKDKRELGFELMTLNLRKVTAQ